MKIAWTIPITSAECERSFSSMRRLRTWLRPSMKMERLGSVAITDIHRQEEVDYKHVSELFFQLLPRKINLTNLLFDWIFRNLKKWTFFSIKSCINALLSSVTFKSSLTNSSSINHSSKVGLLSATRSPLIISAVLETR